MVDVLTDGRLDVGVGRGMEWINYAAFGSDYKTAQDRLEESIFVLQKAWTGEEFAWEGRFFECGKVRVMPTPVQQPHPPIWMTANRDANHFRWIGEQGFHLMTIPWTLPKFDMAAPLIAEYRDALCQAGHDLGSREVLTLFPVYVSDTDESARREVDSYWAHMRDVVADARGDNRREGTADELIADNRALFGSPQTVRRLLERIRDELQPTRLCLHFQYGGLPQELTLKSMRLFMAEVAVAFGA
jgi:alkanesulfonate monooxygenase SsuD/methylene tetrahydromethanopterin reductase-like flavin-dependent oxidoreductase (luciferase family)